MACVLAAASWAFSKRRSFSSSADNHWGFCGGAGVLVAGGVEVEVEVEVEVSGTVDVTETAAGCME